MTYCWVKPRHARALPLLIRFVDSDCGRRVSRRWTRSRQPGEWGSVVRRVLYLTSAIVFVDTLFFAVLTPLLPHYAHVFGFGKAGAGVLSAAYPLGTFVG